MRIRFGGSIRHWSAAGAILIGLSSAAAQSPSEIPRLPAAPARSADPAAPIETLTNSPRTLPPLPGSLADELDRERQSREGFSAGTPEGNRFRFLPNTLLWEPPLAVKRDPRMQFTFSSLPDYKSSFTLDTSIGGTVGLFRYDFIGSDTAVQLDIFGLVITRLATDDLLADDYRFGLPVTWQRGPWSAKIGYEHTSSHIGDKHLQALGLVARSTAKDELVFGLSRILYDRLRLYGHLGYAFGFQVPDVEPTVGHRARADIGFEWYDRAPTGFRGTPFVAGNLEWRGDQDANANITLQAGWLWKNPFQRFGTARVFAEYYRGRSPYGQFIQDRESFYSVGFGFDF